MKYEMLMHAKTWMSLKSIVLSEKKPGTWDYILDHSISVKF